MEAGKVMRMPSALELMVNSRNPAAATIEIGWCMLRGVLEQLEQRKALYPHVLIIVSDERNREQRYLVPLADGMTYIAFRSPGKNKVEATIVWSQEGSRKIRERFLRRDGDKFVTDVRSESGGFFDDLPLTLGYSQIEVSVDKLFFGKEPTPWLKAWATAVWNTPLVHECDIRRRLIFAFTIQPLVYFLKFCAYFLVAVFWSVFRGKRKVSWEPVFKIFGSDVEDIYREAWHTSSLWAGFWRWQFSPTALMAASVIPLFGLIPGNESGTPYKPLFVFIHSFGDYLLYLLAVVVALYALTVVALLIGALISALPMVKQWLEKDAVRAERERVEALDEELDYLVCRGGIPAPVSIGSLPTERRTIRLRFQALKARLCRPLPM